VTRLSLKLVSVLAIPVALIGAIAIALALAGLYMVVFEGVRPGEPIWLDELSPSKSGAALQVAIGAGLVGVALVLRAAIRRKLQA
jgi:hypothetical protein